MPGRTCPIDRHNLPGRELLSVEPIAGPQMNEYRKTVMNLLQGQRSDHRTWPSVLSEPGIHSYLSPTDCAGSIHGSG